MRAQRAVEHDRSRFAARVRRAYVLALGAIAVLSVSSFLLIDGVIRGHDDAAAVINVAGRQRMLSQRIGKLARTTETTARTAETSSADRMQLRVARARLRASIAQMEAAHLGLIEGDRQRNLPGLSSKAEAAFYFEEPFHLDRRVRALLADARIVVEAPGSLKTAFAADRLTDRNSDDLLSALNEAVAFYERRAAAAAAKAELLHLGLLVLTLGTLLAEGLIIFRPLTRELDRTERALGQRKAELVHRSRHDQLTGLLNRHALREAIGDGTIRAPYAVVAIDLDRFKIVNDEHGHEVGDDLLRDVGSALRRSLRDRDAAIRIGGDEFVVVISLDPDTPSQVPHRIASRLRGVIADVCASRPEHRGVSASAGYARHPENGEVFDEVLANADIALYQAKAAGRNRVVAFDPALREEQEQRREEEALLRNCIENDGFFPHFQPQVDMRTGALIGMEALARGDCPENGILAPAAFMETAENTGLIVPLGRQVIEKAIRTAAGWHRDGLEFGRVSVNASTAQLRDPTLPTFLRDTLIEHALPAQCLAVEVVETVLLDEQNQEIVDCCAAIRRLGIAIELDDFGTGYASIANVERLGVERIKIDRSLLAEQSDRDVLGAIITMANGLRLGVLAEGVETAEDESRLTRLGCYEAQGYHYARPMPADDVLEWIASRERGQRPRAA